MAKEPEYLHVTPLGEGTCDVHDWPIKGMPRRLVQAMRNTYPTGINACVKCVERVTAEAKREAGAVNAAHLAGAGVGPLVVPQCACACPDGDCGHDWTGPRETLEDGRGDTVTCAHCGMWAINHDMRVLP